MRRSIDENVRGLPVVLGTSVAKKVFVEVVHEIFWSGRQEKQYHYESTKKLID